MVGRAFLVTLALGTSALADSPKLEQAREAIKHVNYDDAEKLLVDALRDGSNGPAAVAEIYRLSASTAVVLERRELAEQYYRRWLALDPSASLPNDLAPKIREPFIKAQAYMNAHGRLVAKVTPEAVVIVETDPLGMAVSASIDGGTPVKLDADHRAKLDAGKTAAVLDEYGNHLVELAVPVATVEVKKPVETTHHVSFLRRGRTYAIASGVTLGGALVFGYLARSANSDVNDIANTSAMHTLGDLNDARDRRDRWALVANGLYITTGVLVGATVVAYLTQPALTPIATKDTVGLAYARAF